MTPNNQEGQDLNRAQGQESTEPGYPYSYPRPSDLKPVQNGSGTANPFDPNNRPRNPYASQPSNYPYQLPDNATSENVPSILPPYYAPPGQMYQPNNNPYRDPSSPSGTLYDVDRDRPQPLPVQTQGLALPLHKPIWTNIILGVIIAVFILEVVKDGGLEGLASGFSNQTLFDLGALEPRAVREGQWWRLITVMFLHANAIHILFNGYALYVIGKQLEAVYGSYRLLIIYFLCGLSGGIASFGLNLPDGGLAVGASGAIFGLFGALAAYFGRNRNLLGKAGSRQFQSLLVLIVINLFIGASIPNIDNFAHVGGLISGLVLGYVLSPIYTREQLPNGQAAVKDTSNPTMWFIVGLGWLILEFGAFFYFLSK